MITPEPAKQQPKTIVVVDDARDIADMCAFILHELGSYVVVVETESTRAVETITLIRPDLVVSDLQMPRVDGLQLCDMLQENEGTRHVRILFMTGNVQDPRLKARNITQWILKPFSASDLLEAVAASML